LQWWLLVVTAFVLFRLFDIAKPGPVRWAERRFSGGGLRDGLGVMADDLVAGMLAALCLLPVAYAFVLERLHWVATIGLAGRASAGMAP
jgi:phosphatidylglycerophosphatase A